MILRRSFPMPLVLSRMAMPERSLQFRKRSAPSMRDFAPEFIGGYDPGRGSVCHKKF